MSRQQFEEGSRVGRHDMETLGLSFDWMNLEDPENYQYMMGYFAGAIKRCEAFVRVLKRDGVVGG